MARPVLESTQREAAALLSVIPVSLGTDLTVQCGLVVALHVAE